MQAARDWYDRHRPELGDRFASAIEATIAAVTLRPHSCALLFRDVRRAAVQRFPNGVYFRVTNDVIIVVGVFHGRRSPRRWNRRN